MVDISFADAIGLLQKLMKSVVENIKDKKPFEHEWNAVKET